MDTNWTPTIASTDKPLYLAIAKAISDDITQGTLTTDTRLPTHRELADFLEVAIGTVTRAYAEAERRGLIRSEGRRGTFVGERPSGRAVLSQMVREPDGIDLGKLHPLYSLDPDLPSALRNLARDKRSKTLLEYAPAAGFMHHREGGARWLQTLGARTEPDSVFATAGAQHALSIIMASETNRGDTIAAEEFTYPGIKAIAETLDLRIVGIPADNNGIQPDALDEACKRQPVRLLYCNPSFQNPTNSICPRTRREEIATVAEKHGLTVVEDEIMAPMLSHHPGFISDLLPDRSFLVISTSKSIAAGLRVGFLHAPAAARQRTVESLIASCLCVPPLMPELFVRWLDDGTINRVIKRRQADVASRQKLAEDILKGFTFRNQPASYHIWLKLPEGYDSMKLALEAQLRGVTVMPGLAFSADPKPPIEAVRISVVVSPTEKTLADGLRIVADLLRETSGHNLATV